MTEKNKKRFISIKLKFTLLTSAVTILCLSSISFVFLYNSKIIMQRKTIEICRNFAENISNVIREDLVLDATYESTNSVINEIFKSKVEGLESVYIVNVYGKFVVKFNKENLSEFATDTELIYLKNIKVLDFQEIYAEETKKNILKITYPIYIDYNEQSLKIGAAIFEYDRDIIYNPIYEVQTKIAIVGLGITLITLIVTFIASSYITKPIILFSNEVQLIASGVLDHNIQINSSDEIGLLSEEFNEMRNNLKQSYEQLEYKVKERTAELNDNLNLIRRDLAIAQKIQATTLTTDLKEHKNLDIAVKYFAMAEVGGDFYSLNKINDTTSRIFLADATGHGVQAALIVMAIQGIYDSIKNFSLPANEVMEIFNKEFSRRYGLLNTFLTCILLDLDTKNFKLKYSSAGHPPGILINKEGSYKLLPKTGPLIGAKPNCEYALVEYSFIETDRLFIFTDGVFEEFFNEEEFGEDRLYEIFLENKDKSVSITIENVISKLDSFLNHTAKQDDIAIIGIEYKPTPKSNDPS